LAEKAEAAQLWDRIVVLADSLAPALSDRSTAAYLRGSARYGRYKYHIIHQGWEVMLRGYQTEQSGQPLPASVGIAAARYDSLWQAYRELPTDFPQSATLYRPYAFKYVRPDYEDTVGMHSAVARFRP
jgi:hypothetical protein